MNRRNLHPSRTIRGPRSALRALRRRSADIRSHSELRSGDLGPQDAVQAFFGGFGAFIVRFRYLVVAAWILAAVTVNVVLPPLSSITNDDTSSFLPSSQPSMRAARLAAPFQHGTLPQSVLVAARSGRPLTAADQAAVARVEAAVRRVPGVVAVRDQGVSRDGQVRRAQVTLTGNAQGSGAPTYVNAIRTALARAKAPAGVYFYLTGDVATSVDNAAASGNSLAGTTLLSVALILVLLFIVYRALLAPILTFLPPAIALLTAGPIIAQSHKLFGVAFSSTTQILLTIVLLGAGTDYGLFFVFRLREELRRGLDLHSAVNKTLSRVGETITFSAGTVIVAMLCLLLASLGFYQGLGPALAIGIAVLLGAGLTLLPALFAICGRAAFWPTANRSAAGTAGMWGSIAARVVQRPVPILFAGVVLFAGLAVYGLRTYSPIDLVPDPTAASSQSARGTSVLAAHFPVGQANPTYLVLRYATPVWSHPQVLTQATRRLSQDPVFRSVSGPLDPNGTSLSAGQIGRLHDRLGDAAALPVTSPGGSAVPAALYDAYRATAQFISPDGRTVQFYATLRAGAPDSTGAMLAIPSVRAAVARAGQASGALQTGVTGLAAYSYDTGAVSGRDLLLIVPVVLIALGVLLVAVLRSLVAPLYLIVCVGLSYLAALGLAVAIFMGFGHGPGLILYLPFLMFIFLMALGSDYNILVMTRIREEALEHPLSEAVTRAIGATGGTVTSAGVILAATFYVLTMAGGASGQEVGTGITAGILLDTFLVRTVFVPSTVVLLGRWNWWPVGHAAEPVQMREAA